MHDLSPLPENPNNEFCLEAELDVRLWSDFGPQDPNVASRNEGGRYYDPQGHGVGGG